MKDNRRLWVVEIRENALCPWSATVGVGLDRDTALTEAARWKVQGFDARTQLYVPKEPKR